MGTASSLYDVIRHRLSSSTAPWSSARRNHGPTLSIKKEITKLLEVLAHCFALNFQERGTQHEGSAPSAHKELDESARTDLMLSGLVLLGSLNVISKYCCRKADSIGTPAGLINIVHV